MDLSQQLTNVLPQLISHVVTKVVKVTGSSQVPMALQTDAAEAALAGGLAVIYQRSPIRAVSPPSGLDIRPPRMLTCTEEARQR